VAGPFRSDRERMASGAREPECGSLDVAASRLFLCRAEISILQLAMRRVSASPAWTQDHQVHLEALEELFRCESANACLALARSQSTSLAQLQTKAAEVLELCDPDATDLLSLLTRSLCDDVLALADCSFDNRCAG